MCSEVRPEGWLGCQGENFVQVHGILVPSPGIKAASPALEGRFFTTDPPGKSRIIHCLCILTLQKIILDTVYTTRLTTR